MLARLGTCLILIAALTLFACTQTTPLRGGERDYRILLRMQDPELAVAASDVLASLSRQAGARLSYRDRLGEGYHGLIAHDLADADDLALLLRRLAADGRVVRASEDARRQAN